MNEKFQGEISKTLKDYLLQRREKKGLLVDSLGWRLEIYRIHLGFKAYGMAQFLGISQGSYSELQADISSPSCGTIVKIFNLKKNQVNVKWLLTGNV